MKEKTGSELIAEERQRQIEKEGWTPEHDETHSRCTLAVAGASYALDVASRESGEHESWKKLYGEGAKQIWPFDSEWHKPTPDDPIRQLVKAGALICAEIDRLQRNKRR